MSGFCSIAVMPDLAGQPLAEFLADVAAPTPAPGGGSSAAVACALAAALVEMAAGIGGMEDDAATARALRARALELAQADLSSYAPVLEAQRLSADDPQRAERIEAALGEASDVPRAIAATGAEISSLAARVVADGIPALHGDALAGRMIAEAAGAAAAALVALNLGAEAERA
jgi:formiminotetrahydrofolate cyclodeaminase